MISSKLIELVEIHAPRLTADVVADLRSNPRTPGFHRIPVDELEPRLFAVIHHLGNWIGEARADDIRREFEDWGRRRQRQGIPLSEIGYALILLKKHLRRYIQDHGLIDASFPRMEGDAVLPLHLHSLQALNAMVGDFFDEAFYHLARGYEAAAAGR
jgi:hypothetical protein